ncbi:MAG: peptide chain release factor N(5)-glutamine methyltransferase [Opitutus sp.]|mgnify:CR=1 FL=1|nr:peptide chain release factor N(5)-glutamine methyltransferase [Opitutus sp.]
MLSLLEIIKKTTDFFAAKNIESARLNSELIVGHALGLKRMELYLQFERLLTEPELEKIRPLVRRRAQREPLQYVLGETDFCGLKLKVDRRALIPRPETELLVERVIAACATLPVTILDLGTGTGAIALALAQQFADARVTAVDRSEQALALAKENGERCGLSERVRWLESDWFSAIPAEDRYDLIVSNPPYLTAEETAETAPEVREFEPVSALTSGGADGLDDLRTIFTGAVTRLTSGGVLAVETGIAQHAALRALAEELGFTRVESQQDLTERDRFVIAWR